MFAAQAPARLTPKTTNATVIVIRNEYSIKLPPEQSRHRRTNKNFLKATTI